MQRKVIIGAVLAILAATSCVDAPSFDDVPAISNARLELGTDPIRPFDPEETFANLFFDFSDGDGDIGRLPGDSLTTNLFLRNEQLNEPFITPYSIPYIPMEGGVPDITGTVKVQLQISTFQGFCLADPDIGQVEYTLWIEDRAGNRSNTIAVPPIPLGCD